MKKIRLLEKSDLQNGFFETLQCLTEIGNISKDLSYATNIYDKIQEQFNTFIFVALNGRDEVIGTAMLYVEQKFIHNGGKVGHIEDVAVRNEYQRRGIGYKLIQKCKEQCIKMGCYKIILTAKEKNKYFYEKCGFYQNSLNFRIDL